MMHDADIEAKEEAAVRKVARLLPMLDSLTSVNSIRSDYALRQQVLRFLTMPLGGFSMFVESRAKNEIVVVFVRSSFINIPGYGFSL